MRNERNYKVLRILHNNQALSANIPRSLFLYCLFNRGENSRDIPIMNFTADLFFYVFFIYLLLTRDYGNFVVDFLEVFLFFIFTLSYPPFTLLYHHV